jgi:hypothetical protein
VNPASPDLPEPRHGALVRAARSLLDDKKRGRHIDLGFESFAEYAASLGYPSRRSRELLDLGRVLCALPALVPLVERGDVSPQAAGALAPVVAEPKALRLPPGATDLLPDPEAAACWIDAAARLGLQGLVDEVAGAVERARVWPLPVERITIELDRKELAALKRARALASQIHERPIAESELLELALKHYLDRYER